jgi:hypothetical protein
MALRPDRNEHLTDLSYFMNETGERGIVVIHDSGGSGAAMDDSAALVKAPGGASDAGTTVSGTIPAGLLLNDVVNLDLTRQHINFAKDEVQKGSKVLILRRGTVVTDQISGTPTIGAVAYLNNLGQISATAIEGLTNDSVTQVRATPSVGRFLSIKDADGYAKVEIDISDSNTK